MTRNEVFAPFQLTEGEFPPEGNATGATIRYSVDVTCEIPTPWEKNEKPFLNSSWGCSVLAPLPRTSTDLDFTDEKPYDAQYVGFWNLDGNAKYYLSSGACPKNASNTFLAQWSKLTTPASALANISSDEWRQHAEISALWCRSEYFQEPVELTVSTPSNAVLGWRAIGPSSPLPPDMFNATLFENAMNVGRINLPPEVPIYDGYSFRTEFPTLEWPDQTSYLQNTALDTAYLANMVPFAVGATKLEMDDYLLGHHLADAYRSAYQLLFARQMSQVLSPTIDSIAATPATIAFSTQAFALVPAFTYVVEALLAIAALSAAALLLHTRQRATHLRSDPSIITALMSLAAADDQLLRSFGEHDRASAVALSAHFKDGEFELVDQGDECMPPGLRFRHVPQNVDDNRSVQTESKPAPASDLGERSLGAYPLELSLKIGSMFLGLQVLLCGLIAVLFILIQKRNGLPLPGSSQFVQQLVESYILTAVGTLIEPFWVVLNRNLCSLQPFEALRKGRKTAKESIGLNYSSLPPQLVIGTATLNRDYLLATICFMTLLANVLSVSLSGLLVENTVNVATPISFNQTLTTQFGLVDGSAPTYFGVAGGTILDSIFIAESNRSAHTPLPPWTDAKFFHIPASAQNKSSGSSMILTTDSLGATLDCQPLSAQSVFSIQGTGISSANFSDIESQSSLTVVLEEAGREITCLPRNTRQAGRPEPGYLLGRPTGPSAHEFAYALAGTNQSSPADAAFCLEHVAVGWVHANSIAGENLRSDETSVPIVLRDVLSTILVCRSQIMTARSDLTVSYDGHILKSTATNVAIAEADRFLSTRSDVLGSAHQFIINRGDRWHNDSFSSDWGNYLIAKSMNSSRLLDPSAPLPTFDEVTPAFSSLYSELFAIWLSRNQGQLLVAGSAKDIEGSILTPTTRIFMSKTMFIISESILLAYIAVTISLYIKRPWKILNRLPSDLASIIAFFAASRAVDDMRNTAHFTTRERSEHLNELNDRYGFGNFIDREGRNHLGIEKYPYVASLVRHETYTSSADPRAHTASIPWPLRFRQWKSGKVTEGGWL